MTKDAKADKSITAALTIGERLLLQQLLPDKGPIATARLVRTLGDRLSLTETEIAEHKVKTHESIIRWEDTKWEREFSFGGFELELILAQLRKASEAEALTPAHVPLWDKFCPLENGK